MKNYPTRIHTSSHMEAMLQIEAEIKLSTQAAHDRVGAKSEVISSKL